MNCVLILSVSKLPVYSQEVNYLVGGIDPTLMATLEHAKLAVRCSCRLHTLKL